MWTVRKKGQKIKAQETHDLPLKAWIDNRIKKFYVTY